MSRLGVRSTFIAAVSLSAAAAFGWMHWAGSNLYYNGKVASANVIMQNGVPYFPIRDIAAALSLSVQPRADGYTLIKSGGANQVAGLQGKIGDDLFNGAFRVKVVRVVRGDHYQRQFSKGDNLDGPNGDDIVAVIMHVKNGMKQAKTVDLMPGGNTALTDENDHSYGPFTGGYVDIPERAPTLIPGAATDFALTFHVPKNAVLKDLVYSPKSLVYDGGPDFRISLKEP
jgi:hypothetical protein